MKRFYATAGMITLGLALLLGYRLSKIPWEPQTAFDIIGFLWLLQNLPKAIGYFAAWALGALALGCFWKALTAPTVQSDLDSEQRRLISHFLVDPVEARGPGQVPGSGGAEP